MTDVLIEQVCKDLLQDPRPSLYAGWDYCVLQGCGSLSGISPDAALVIM